ncbi:MAG: sugar phosphate isomerase/epimerase [Armatimonadota bacterium]|nr:MAG: sugar phosphate isomerase/epimerase [Armatimonadota bacterium]
MKIGAMTTSFRKPFYEALEASAALKVDGVQIWATNLTYYDPDHPVGELDPELTTEEDKRKLKETLKRLGMGISALCGDLGRGFVGGDHISEDVEKTKRMMDLARSLGVKVLTSHIGRIPEDKGDPAYRVATEALEEIGAHGDAIGVTFASETGPESGAALAEFLKGLKAKSIRANYDPANMVMTGFDPVQGVRDLEDLIVHTHAKDGMGPGPNRGEVPLGEGEVPWPEYLRALKEIGYDGYLTIEREVGEDPAADIVTAAGFLREQLARL